MPYPMMTLWQACFLALDNETLTGIRDLDLSEQNTIPHGKTNYWENQLLGLGKTVIPT